MTSAASGASEYRVTIETSYVDSQQQFVTFKVVCGTFTTTVAGCVPISDCSGLTQPQIVDRAWAFAKANIANWLAYVQRTDIDLAAMAGQAYVPAT